MIKEECTDGGREHVSSFDSTYEIAVEALAELKHASSVRQRPWDVERLTA